MSILSGKEILKQYLDGRVIIKPFIPDNLGPNSYDLTLAPEILTYDLEDGDELDIRRNNKVIKTTIPEGGIVLWPGTLYLGCTNEIAGSDYYVPCIEGRSSFARLGLQVHISAGFGDCGFVGAWTLELLTTHFIRIYPNVRICQIYFEEVKGEITLYKGKYNGANTVQASKAHLDFEG